MDILLFQGEGRMHLRPSSVHGMLWLQTHFEDQHWEALASNEVKLTQEDAKVLSAAAEEAGLRLNSLPSVSLSSSL